MCLVPSVPIVRFIWMEPPLATYRRNGEGDYKCTKEEYQAMVRDASVRKQDMLVLNEMDMTVFNKESVRSYRQLMRLSRPGHVWEALEDEDFLMKLGAVGIGSDGKKHPTSAGLLMFGNEYDIVREYNAYFLDYQEQYDADTRWTDRIISSSGDWSGNVYDFYFRVYNKLTQDIKKQALASIMAQHDIEWEQKGTQDYVIYAFSETSRFVRRYPSRRLSALRASPYLFVYLRPASQHEDHRLQTNRKVPAQAALYRPPRASVPWRTH